MAIAIALTSASPAPIQPDKIEEKSEEKQIVQTSFS